MADLDSAFEATEKTVEESKKALEEKLQRQQADDRSHIAKLIVWAFVILVGWVVIAATIGGYFLEWSRLIEPGKFLMVILGSVMLPVVTLVIGYYFAKEK